MMKKKAILGFDKYKREKIIVYYEHNKNEYLSRYLIDFDITTHKGIFNDYVPSWGYKCFNSDLKYNLDHNCDELDLDFPVHVISRKYAYFDLLVCNKLLTKTTIGFLRPNYLIDYSYFNKNRTAEAYTSYDCSLIIHLVMFFV